MLQNSSPVKGRLCLPSVSFLINHLHYDADSGKLIWIRHPNWKFFGREAGYIVRTITYGHQRQKAYRHLKFGRKTFPAHRIIWKMQNGPFPLDMEIDHINGDGLDNRYSNLRLVTKQEQARNCARPMSNTSGHVGVRRNRNNKYWDVFVAGKKYGTFGSYREAVERSDGFRQRLGFHENHGRD